MSEAYQNTLEDVLFEKYQALRNDIGPRYASMMEGYGHMVNILGTVEAFFKDCKKYVKNFIPAVGAATQEATLADLNTMESEAVMMANAALTMAALARLYRDTVKNIAGGDLLDMIEGE
mgnify:CR=1 FL=1